MVHEVVPRTLGGLSAIPAFIGSAYLLKGMGSEEPMSMLAVSVVATAFFAFAVFLGVMAMYTELIRYG